MSITDTVKMAENFCKLLKFSKKKYRKMLSALRNHLNIIECKMCANKWGEIDYNSVPSKANVIYKDAFIKHDEERRTTYLKKLREHDSSVKINTSVLEPYEIVHKYSGFMNARSKDESLELLWENLPRTNVLKGKNMICVHDNSGSMSSCVSQNGNVTCRDVADSLAIYCSELLSGPWANKFITFSENPKIVDLTDDESLQSKLRSLYKKVEIANTNIKAVFDLILNVAVKNHVNQEEIPDVLVLSDMEFDSCVTDSYDCDSWYRKSLDSKKMKTLFENISEQYAEYGFKMPRLIFWNIGSRTMGIPVRENENGVMLVSGFSKNVFKMVASGNLDPFDALKEQLNSPRYDMVKYALDGQIGSEP